VIRTIRNIHVINLRIINRCWKSGFVVQYINVRVDGVTVIFVRQCIIIAEFGISLSDIL